MSKSLLMEELTKEAYQSLSLMLKSIAEYQSKRGILEEILEAIKVWRYQRSSLKDIAKPKEDLLEQEEPYREHRMYYMPKKFRKEGEVIRSHEKQEKHISKAHKQKSS